MDVRHFSIEQVPEEADVIVTHKNLLQRAEKANAGKRIIPIGNFLKDEQLDSLLEEIIKSVK